MLHRGLLFLKIASVQPLLVVMLRSEALLGVCLSVLLLSVAMPHREPRQDAGIPFRTLPQHAHVLRHNRIAEPHQAV